MGKYLIGGIAGLILGGIIAFFSLSAMVGAGAGAGIAVGLSSGVCLTVNAAQELGIMTAEQVDEVLNQASNSVRETAGAAAGPEIVGSAAQCDEVLARLRTAAEG